MKLRYAGTHSAPAGRDFPSHSHTCWELVLYRSGRIEAPVGEHIFETRPGLLLLTPPGVMHSEKALTAYSNIFVHLEDGDPGWPLAIQDGDGRLEQLFGWMVREFADPRAGHEDMLAALTSQLKVCLRRAGEASATNEMERVVRAVETYFEEHAAHRFEIRQVAVDFGVASSTLRAYFATQRGKSPAEVLQEIRLRQALALLRGSNLKLEAVAAATGFYSASHLSRCVRQQTGRTPGGWRSGTKSNSAF